MTGVADARRTLRVSVAAAPATWSEEWLPAEVSWPEFIDLAGVYAPGTVKDCGGVFGGALNGTRKVDEAVLSRSVVYLDADKAEPDFPVEFQMVTGYVAAVMHTTYSHEPGQPRYRVHIPLSHDVSGHEAKLITWALMEAIGLDQFDVSCAQPARMMYLASARNGTFRALETGSRVFLDADEWIARARETGIAERLERVVTGGMVLNPADRPPNAYEKNKALLILRKAARDFDDTVDAAGGRNNALMRVLPTLYRLVEGHCLAAEEVDDVMWEAVQACRTGGSGPFSEREWREVRTHAWGYVDEGGLPSVDEAGARDDFGVVAVPEPDASGQQAFDGTYAVPAIRDLFAYGPARFTRNGGGLDVAALARHLCSVVPFGRDRDNRLLAYRGGVWRDGEDDLSQATVVVFDDLWTKAKREHVAEYLRASPDTPRISRDAVAPWLINCRNGMVEWRTGLVQAHDPALRSTYQVPHVYDPLAECPAFERFLDQVFLGDEALVEFVWEVLGYLLLPGNPLHKMVLLWGPKGRNGKGTLLRVVTALLGAENVSALSLDDIAKDKFRVAELYGKTANIGADIDSTWIERTAVLKGLTGGDEMAADRKYGQPFSFTPWAVPVFSANELFGVNDSSDAFFARWLVVPFKTTFKDREDVMLSDRLRDEGELRGVLAKAVDALARLMERGRFDPPEAVLDAQAEMAKAGDSVRRWLDDYCDLADPGAWTQASALWTAYQMSDDGDAKLGRNKFYRRLGQIGGITPTKHVTGRGFRGVALRPDGGPDGG